MTATLAAMRFGYGLPLPDGAGQDAQGVLAALDTGDEMAVRWPLLGMAKVQLDLANVRRLRPGSRVDEAVRAQYLAALADLEAKVRLGERHSFARALDAPDGFRERLVQFWSDHFTVVAREVPTRIMTYTIVEDAIRPYLASSFEQMFVAAELHPAMLLYLDQINSVGPNTNLGKRRGRGLNENLAREMIELHSLGAGAGYSQQDVRQLAELLTGITYSPIDGLHYDKNRAEPGPEQILGREYTGESLDTIRLALRDLARHPETRAHICRKIAVHFISDTPQPDLLAQMEAAWGDAGGDLRAVYAAMLSHSTAWDPVAHKVRQPFEFLVAALRALGVDGAGVVAMSARDFQKLILDQMLLMGQRMKRPIGPDGWPEEQEAWITPQGLASRITWAMEVPGRLVNPLPDPGALAMRVLGDRLTDVVRKAATRAESQREGVGMVLASAEFNRR
ncbi:MAG: DUF1800 family protein [Microgenomates group bacterium]